VREKTGDLRVGTPSGAALDERGDGVVDRDLPRDAGAAMGAMIMGFRTTQLVHTAARLGIADLLADGPRDASALADAVGAHPRALYRLLRALASLGVFAETDDGRFELTPLAQTLRSDAPGSLCGLALLYGDEWLWRAASPFLEEGFTVYAVDRRGRGGSGPHSDGYAVELFAREVTRFLARS